MESLSRLPILIPAEEIQDKFKFKLDIYTAMRNDSKFLKLLTYSELFSSII